MVECEIVITASAIRRPRTARGPGSTETMHTAGERTGGGTETLIWKCKPSATVAACGFAALYSFQLRSHIVEEQGGMQEERMTGGHIKNRYKINAIVIHETMRILQI